MVKKKKGRPRKTKVKLSEPHRRRGGWVGGYFRRRTRKAFRNKAYSRNPRRTPEQIAKKGTRKQEREKKRKEEIKQARARTKKKPMRRTIQLRFGKPKGPPKV